MRPVAGWNAPGVVGKGITWLLPPVLGGTIEPGIVSPATYTRPVASTATAYAVVWVLEPLKNVEYSSAPLGLNLLTNAA